MPETLNTLYSVGRLPELPELAKKLEAQLGWKPVYWITQPELEDGVKTLFPDAYRHNFTRGNRAAGDPLIRSDLPPAPQSTTSSLQWLQLLQTLSRHVLGGAIGAEQQIAIINERMDYCLRVVSALNIKRFVLASTPHALLDMCFYVAVRTLGGEVRMHHLTGFRGLQVVLDDPGCLPPALTALGQIDGNLLSAEGLKTLDELLDSSKDQTPWYVRQQDEKTQTLERFYQAADKLLDAGEIVPGTVSFDTPPLLPDMPAAPETKTEPSRPRFFWLFRNKPARLARPVPAKAKRDLFARRFQPKHDASMGRAFIHRASGFASPPITWREYYTYRDWALLQKRAWQRRYEALTADFDIETATAAPFVVFALHYQPERTTMPEGGWFADQELAIRMIADTLPSGWKLLVKEHPSQFLWQTEGELARDDGYYDRLAALPGVTLVPLDIASSALVEHAKAVVTITGTIGWEAALKGTPTITLAQPWYAAVGITLPATDERSLAEVFQQIEAGWRPDAQAIRTHLARIEAIGTRCFINPSHALLYEEISPEDNLKALADLFIKTERLLRERKS